MKNQLSLFFLLLLTLPTLAQRKAGGVISPNGTSAVIYPGSGGGGGAGTITEGYPVSMTAMKTLTDTIQIFVNAETVRPSDSFSLNGFFPASASVRVALSEDVPHVGAVILSQSRTAIVARMPDKMPMGVYRVWVESATQRSAPVYLNKAITAGLNSPEIYSKGPFEITGVNLLLPGKTPIITFQSQTNSARTPAAFVASGSDGYRVKGIAPDGLVVGQRYSVFIDPDPDDSSTEVQVRDSVQKTTYGMLALTPAPDVLGLNIGWSPRITTGVTSNTYNTQTDSRLTTKTGLDSTVNSYPAFTAAFTRAASDGGGIVEPPEGTYKMDPGSNTWFGPNLGSGVILRGGGKGIRLLFNQAGSATMERMFGTGASITGMINVTVVNANTTSNSAIGGGGRWADPSSYTFFKDVTYVIQGSQGNELLYKYCLLLDNFNVIQSLNRTGGPVNINNSRYVTVRGGTSRFARGWGIVHPEQVMIEGHTFLTDGNFPTYPNEDFAIRPISIDYATSTQIRGNTFKAINGPLRRTWFDGTNNRDANWYESILFERGTNAVGLTVGQVGAASGASTLVRQTGTFSAFPIHYVVAIPQGKGKGQWREITGLANATTLNLTAPWKIIPDTSSRFTTFNFAAANTTIIGNNFSGMPRGVQTYFTSTDRFSVINNTFEDNVGYVGEPIDQAQNNNFSPTFNTTIMGNTSNGSRSKYSTAIFGVNIVQLNPNPFGTLVFGATLRDNTVIGRPGTDLNTIGDKPAFATGVSLRVNLEAAGYNTQGGKVTAIEGGVIEKNTFVDVDTYLRVGTGTTNTVLYKNSLINSGPLQDQTLTGNAGGSTGTVQRP